MKNIYDMNLFETANVTQEEGPQQRLTRVPGGWVLVHYNSSVFIPFNNEFIVPVDSLDVIARQQGVEPVTDLDKLKKSWLSYICAECGRIAYTDCESLDSGTTLTCEECGGETVVSLMTISEYCGR